MSKLNSVLFLIVCLIFISCFKYNSKKIINQEYDKIKKCRDNWLYEDLKERKELKVLLFDKKMYFHNHYFPNFIIGVTSTNDTMAILDMKFEGLINKSSLIIAEPHQWSNEEKEEHPPVFIVHKKPEEDDLLCRVKYVYYCKITSASR